MAVRLTRRRGGRSERAGAAGTSDTSWSGAAGTSDTSWRMPADRAGAAAWRSGGGRALRHLGRGDAARAAPVAAVSAVDGLAQGDGLEHHDHEADVDLILVVGRRAVEALTGLGLDALGLLAQALARLGQLLPALAIERHRQADEGRVAVVEATRGRGGARVVVDYLQRRADGRLLG